jgi:flagellar motor switch protein FliM
MSNEVARLHEAILNRLRATTGSDAQPSETPAPEAAEYDWAHPSHFTREQLAKISKFSVQMGEKVSEAMSSRLRNEIVFQADPITQHFASGLNESLAQEIRYYGTILDESDEPCGLIVLSTGHAAEWVATILGGEATADATERELTDLEYGLLADILKEMIGALSAASEAAGGGTFHSGEGVTKGEFSLPGDAASEFCRIDLRQEEAPPEQSVPFILLCEAIEPITIEELGRSRGETHIDARTTIAGHLERTTMKAEALIGIGEATLEEVLSLEEGDVLLIERRVYDPIELVVGGQPILAGIPVTCSGRYGLQVTVSSGVLSRTLSAADGEDQVSTSTDRDNDQERNQTDG